VLVSAAGGVESLTEIISATPSLSTWKLNNPKAISKPPVLAETAPVGLEVSMMVDLAMSTSASGGAVSMTVGTAMPTLMVDARRC
jgi:hypothetical protein